MEKGAGRQERGKRERNWEEKEVKTRDEREEGEAKGYLDHRTVES